MFCVLEELRERVTALSSLSFFSVSVISALEDFVSALLKSCPRSVLRFASFLSLSVCVCSCVTRLANSGNNTDVLIEIQRLAAKLGGRRTHVRALRDSRGTFTLGD